MTTARDFRSYLYDLAVNLERIPPAEKLADTDEAEDVAAKFSTVVHSLFNNTARCLGIDVTDSQSERNWPQVDALGDEIVNWVSEVREQSRKKLIVVEASHGKRLDALERKLAETLDALEYLRHELQLANNRQIRGGPCT